VFSRGSLGFLAKVCLFYLVLRGLDTIEDDMSIDIDLKESLLRHLHEKLNQPGWTFDGCQSLSFSLCHCIHLVRHMD
jgi:phytoene/squalene synthetase